ncbi:MAG TPA: hypothetical protein VIJ25_16245, partial [Methylococcales bacterium]
MIDIMPKSSNSSRKKKVSLDCSDKKRIFENLEDQKASGSGSATGSYSRKKPTPANLALLKKAKDDAERKARDAEDAAMKARKAEFEATDHSHLLPSTSDSLKTQISLSTDRERTKIL